jgi:hypothetical protein
MAKTRCAAAAKPDWVIANSTGPNKRVRALSVTDSLAEVLPTSTATTIVDGVTGALCTDTTKPPGRVRRTRARRQRSGPRTLRSSKESLTIPS